MEHRKQIMCVLVLMVLFVGAIIADDAEDTATETEIPKSIKPETEADKLNKTTTYAFAFETENGQVRDENIQVNPETSSSKMETNVKGSYSFISEDGYEYTVHYRADKMGFYPYATVHKIKADGEETP